MSHAGRTAWPSTYRARRRRSATGFTMTDLIVMLSGLALMAFLFLLMASSADCDDGYPVLTRCLAQRKNLEDGAENYRHEHDGYYPGQQQPGRIGSTAGKYTGSQILAACLYDYVDEANTTNPFHKIDEGGLEPTGFYAAYKDEFLTTLNGRKRVLSDLFPKGQEMAFCYYPWRETGESAAVGEQYLHADNAAHTEGREAGSFADFITDKPSGGNAPYKRGRFLLIAPGVDREYFSADDIKNW